MEKRPSGGPLPKDTLLVGVSFLHGGLLLLSNLNVNERETAQRVATDVGGLSFFISRSVLFVIVVK